jgi:hypothetical protein
LVAALLADAMEFATGRAAAGSLYIAPCDRADARKV